jgi:hypothetical protein
MEQKVKISDYEDKQHLMMVALNMVGLHVDYITVDLIHSTLLKLTENGPAMNVTDAVVVKDTHSRKWIAYFKEQENEK